MERLEFDKTLAFNATSWNCAAMLDEVALGIIIGSSSSIGAVVMLFGVSRTAGTPFSSSIAFFKLKKS